jgi:hypothetical protein
MDLFQPGAPWGQAASQLQVFKLYGEWVGNASAEELGSAVADIQRRGMALAVEWGPLDAPPECGQGVEGFAGTAGGLSMARKIQSVGGRLDLIALDEPFFFAQIYDGSSACRWDTARIAGEVAEFISAIRSVFPNVVVGDTEPLAGGGDPAVYRRWLESFRDVNGYDLAFLHLDMDWARPDWPAEVKAIEEFGRTFGIPTGIIYNGNQQDPTDEAWLSIAGERVTRYELEEGGQPEHVLFQSWQDKPDRTLPESDPYTFTGFIRTYFEDRSALGFRTEGGGANLAYGKPARVSQVFQGLGGQFAVDGDPGTVWNSGGGPLQWIQIDLGAAYSIAQIRLVVSQSPGGRTIHLLYGRGPGTGDEQQLLQTFDGETQDSDILTYAPAEPLEGIRHVWIDTTRSPSWVSWREIEVIAAP